MKLMADVIDLAINEYLWDGYSYFVERPYKMYSCYAIKVADKSRAADIMNFLQSMGIDTIGALEFSSVPYGQKRQFARALWLTWAAMIAREEGLTL